MLNKPDPASVTYWLFMCCGMIFIMALLGAITRLTMSGLSMTSWDPVMGAIPPLSPAAWATSFDAYQKTPQFQILNKGMTLDAYKYIFFWEWFHRLWGRAIGLVFAAPLIFFVVRGKISKATGFKFALVFVLGGLQGFIGWFMVQSGLAVRTSVSPYRLAMHLAFALVIYAILLWTALKSMPRSSAPRPPFPSLVLNYGWATLVFLTLTMTWGAFVAGLHAGEVYNTWPLMEGDMLPDAALTLRPLWRNFFENSALAQFVHRWLAPTTMFLIWGWIASCWRRASAAQRKGLIALGAMSIIQIGLGIATLLSHAEIAVAVIHQAGAITLLSLLLFNLQRFSEKQTDRR